MIPWWDELGHHQQKLRRAELRRFFTWMQRSGHCKKLAHNPFTSNDELARLEVKPCPPKVRSRLSPGDFRTTYQEAGQRGYSGLQLAMALSLLTTMRQGDVLNLRFSDIRDGRLQVTIGKSEAQRGTASAARLQWSLVDHPRLSVLINEAREHSLSLARCPFVVAYRPPLVRSSKKREHRFQMLPRQLTEQFAECRPQRPNPPTFHEVRSLSSSLFRDAGCSVEEIQTLMAHTDEKVTLGYMDGHQLPFLDVQTPEVDAALDLLG